MTLKRGDIVICINNTRAKKYLTIGNKYKITDIGNVFLNVNDIYILFRCDRFKKVNKERPLPV